MKTDELIDLLAKGAGAAPQGLVGRRIGLAAALGLLAGAAGALAVLGPIPAEMYEAAAPWFKLAYALALAGAALWLTSRLARPVGRIRGPASLAALAVLAAAVVGLAAWAATPAEARASGLMGHSWAGCPWWVLALSLPAQAGLMWALRGLAPTRLRAAGFAAGLAAGALAAAGYALSCTELALSFVAVWYTLGIALAGGLGALWGPRMLRW